MLHRFPEPAGDMLGPLQAEGRHVGRGDGFGRGLRRSPGRDRCGPVFGATPGLSGGQFAGLFDLTFQTLDGGRGTGSVMRRGLAQRPQAILQAGAERADVVRFRRRCSTCFSIACRRATEVSVWPERSATVSVSIATMDCRSSFCSRKWVRWCAGNRCRRRPLRRWRCPGRSWRTGAREAARQGGQGPAKAWKSGSFPRTMWVAMASRSRRPICSSASTTSRSAPRALVALLQKALDRDHRFAGLLVRWLLLEKHIGGKAVFHEGRSRG